MLYSHHQRRTQAGLLAGNPTINGNTRASSNPWQPASYRGVSRTSNVSTLGAPPTFADPQNTRTGSFPAPVNHRVNRNVTVASGLPVINNATGSQTSYSAASQPVLGSPAIAVAAPVSSNSMAWASPGMTPDYAKAETLVFSGDANGPDLSLGPMSFTPTIDIASLFRFDLSESWVTQRWQRVSTCPGDQGLHGLRVALVTGTNSWDLHGALTYYFDSAHQLQRITYRGWTGDATRLLQILQQQHQLRAQPTHWAGVYLSKRNGLLMKHPAVIDKSNVVQQLALILELNNPAGSNNLSEDFQSLSRAAVVSR